MRGRLKQLNPLYMVLLVLAVLLLGFALKKLLIYLIFCAATIVITYFNYYARFPIDFTPVFFLSVIITFTYGLGHSLFFVLISTIPAQLIAGYGFGVKTVFYTVLNFIINLTLVTLNPSNILLSGFLASVAYFFISSVVSDMMDSQFEKGIFVSIINIGISLFYFWNFGSFLLRIIV
jgi:hypothetical protein